MSYALNVIMSPAWAMEDQALRNIMRTAHNELEAPTALEAYRPLRLAGAERATSRNGVAVINAVGPLLKRAGLFVDLIGGTAYETMRRDLQAAVDNPAIKSILLNVDTPGGEAAGVGELAAAVASFRGQGKPIVAYAGDLAASAGYWLASAADRIVIGAGAALGSIGVRATYADSSAWDKARGVNAVEFVSSQSPFKKSDLTTDEGRNRMQARIDSMAQVFVETVAANRGVSVDHVLDKFGRGDVLIGKAAVAAGMADSIGTFESTLAKLAAGWAPFPRVSVPKGPAPLLAKTLAPISAPKVLAPGPTPRPAPVVPSAVAADRERAAALLAITPAGADEEFRVALRRGDSVEAYRETLAVREIEAMLHWARGG